MLDHLALLADLGQRVDADRKMHVRPIAAHAGVAFAGFHAFRRQRLIGDE